MSVYRTPCERLCIHACLQFKLHLYNQSKSINLRFFATTMVSNISVPINQQPFPPFICFDYSSQTSIAVGSWSSACICGSQRRLNEMRLTACRCSYRIDRRLNHIWRRWCSDHTVLTRTTPSWHGRPMSWLCEAADWMICWGSLYPSRDVSTVDVHLGFLWYFTHRQYLDRQFTYKLQEQ